MSRQNLVLVNEPGHVFETFGSGQHWIQEGSSEGMRVEANSIDVNLALVELCCLLPPFSPAAPGRYPIFAVEAVEACEPGRSSGIGGVLLRVAYEPSEGLFHFGMNAGTRQHDPEWVCLGPASPEHIEKRVLKVSVLIAPTGLYPSVEDVSPGHDELLGELALAVDGPRRLSPWGCHGANWRITSGCEAGGGERSFPAGFGLSDVRITLIDEAFDVADTMVYSGDLDHLVSPLWEDGQDTDQGDWDSDFGDEEPISRMLRGLAEQLHAMSGNGSTWAHRAEGLAQETQELKLRLPESPEVG